MEFNEKICNANNSHRRYVVHQGGTGSGKTFATLQYLAMYAVKYKGVIVSVVGETLPHLKRGALRDFKRILQTHGWADDFKENKTEHTFTAGDSIVEFFSADSEAKLRGARRDILFINECNNVDYESFQQLDVRTRYQTILDFNPVRRFWVHDKLLPTLPADDYLFCKSTYLDNKYLLPEEKRNIERRRTNANWWKVYGEGEIGMAEGVVFSNWEIMPQGELIVIPVTIGSEQPASSADRLLEPEKANSQINSTLITNHSSLPGTLLGYGIDFGFTHAPTAVVQVNEYEGELYIHELLYRTGVQNDELFAFAREHLDMRALAVADSAEPKTVDYLYRKGWYGLKPAEKGPDSIIFGLNLLVERKLHVTTDSLNIIKELREYMWDTNKDRAFMRRPIKEYDHAIDAIRYLYAYPKKRPFAFT